MEALALLLGMPLVAWSSPPVVFTAAGGYPRTTQLANGTTLLATSHGATCGFYSYEHSKGWREGTGPKFTVIPGSDLSNCAPGEAPDGALLAGVRHHDPDGATFRIQLKRSSDAGHTWEGPVTTYATTMRQHAAWEPVFFKSRDGKTLRVAYSLERPAEWTPPACEVGTNYPGSDLASPEHALTADLCQGRCAGNASCNAWSWRSSDQMCWLKASKTKVVPLQGLTSGTKLCGAGMGLATEITGLAALSRHRNLNVSFERFSASGPGGLLRGHLSGALEQDIVVQESSDSGYTWGPVRVISRTKGSRDGMPSLVRQKDGCLVCVFEGFGGTSWGHFTVNAVRSCDDGKTWVKQKVFPYPFSSTAHAPTVALLQDGRAVVSSYNEPHDLQLQFSEKPLAGSSEANWLKPVVEVPGAIAWPDVFSDGEGQLFVAYGSGGQIKVAGPILPRTPLVLV